MSDKTGIAWTDATWNPVTGCSKVSPGCAHCYAETLALTRLAGKPGYPGLPWTPANAEANVVLRPDRLDQPLRWRAPRRIFVNSMSDLFHERVPDEFILEVFNVIREATQHTFQVLTKRPERMADLCRRMRFDPAGSGRMYLDPTDAHPPSGYPIVGGHGATGMRNLWLGTSVENQHWADVRIPHLLATPAAVRFLSLEPLLGPVDLRLALFGWCPEHDFPSGFCLQRHHPGVQHIDWVIVGGESGPGHRPMDPAWVRAIADQCDAAGIPLFVKQASGPRSGMQGNLPDDLWAHKEMPL